MNGIYWLYLWQLKEYRLDRLVVDLKQYSVWRFAKEYVIGLPRLPKLTPKLLLIAGVSAIVFLFVAWSLMLLVSILPLIVLLYLLLPLIVSIGVLIINIPSFFIKRMIIRKATQKMRQYQDLYVIGITGSYGKTGTKDAIAAVLSERFTVVKTPGGINVDVAIARFILDHDFTNDEIFVVEMGAYKEGEIKQMMDMVRPIMGVLTGINEQHLELFGGIERTTNAKFEIVENLPDDGIVVLNTHNQRINNNFNRIGTRTVLAYGASDPSENQNAAIVIARYLGMDDEEIDRGLIQISGGVGRQAEYYTKDGIYVIDNTYSSNPTGFRSAMKRLQICDKKQKIIVTTGVYQLGAESAEVNGRLGQEAYEIADVVIVTEANHAGYYPKAEFIPNGSDLVQYLKPILDSNTAILLEGRHRAITIMKEFLNDEG